MPAPSWITGLDLDAEPVAQFLKVFVAQLVQPACVEDGQGAFSWPALTSQRTSAATRASSNVNLCFMSLVVVEIPLFPV